MIGENDERMDAIYLGNLRWVHYSFNLMEYDRAENKINEDADNKSGGKSIPS